MDRELVAKKVWRPFLTRIEMNYAAPQTKIGGTVNRFGKRELQIGLGDLLYPFQAGKVVVMKAGEANNHATSEGFFQGSYGLALPEKECAHATQ